MHHRHLLATLAFVIAGVASAETRPPAADPGSRASAALSEGAEFGAAEAATGFIAQAEEDTLSEEEFERSAAYDRAYSDYRRALVRDLRESGNPRDWALAAQLPGDQDATEHSTGERAALLNNAAMAAPEDVVVQWLWAHSTLESAGTCGSGGLDPRRVERLLSVEPTNAAVWLRKLDLAYAAHDEAAIDDALTRMAASSHYDEHTVELWSAWQQVYLAHPPPAMPADLDSTPVVVNAIAASEATALGLGMAQATTTLPAMQSLMRVCDAADGKSGRWQRYAICGDAARRLTHSTLTISRLIGHAVLRKSNQQWPEDVADWRENRWIYEQFTSLPEDPGSIVAFMHEWRARGHEWRRCAQSCAKQACPSFLRRPGNHPNLRCSALKPRAKRPQTSVTRSSTEPTSRCNLRRAVLTGEAQC